ncbi:MAG: DUF1501 domain-containing protein [Pirellulaceae bacterium]
MLSLFPARGPGRTRLTRRRWLTMAGLAGAAFPLGWQQILQADEAPRAVTGLPHRHARGTAQRCIYIFLCGGPSQPDLWDMKPTAPTGVRSVFSPISTNVAGIQFGELLPQLSRHADKLTLIRSMTHTNNDHNGAIVHSLLGQLPPRPGELYASRSDHPGIGGILHKAYGECGHLPAWVVLPRPFATSSPPYKGQFAGFLGSAFDPVSFQKENRGSLSDAPLELAALKLPEGLSEARQRDRAALRTEVGRSVQAASTRRLDDLYEQASDLITSPCTRTAFELEQEPAALRDRYGRNEYGQSFLMARRLVESGVRFVNVFWTFFDAKGCQFNLWDNHGVEQDVCGVDGQRTGLQQLTHKYCTPSFDQAFSALLEDLSQRGLLDDTLVVVAGEFGRTPKINKTSGRDHWAHCYTQLLAGGGVRGGQVYGASDAQGAYVKDQPVTPDDFAATILHAFGIPPEAAIPDITGRPVRVTTGTPVTSLF